MDVSKVKPEMVQIQLESHKVLNFGTFQISDFQIRDAPLVTVYINTAK
jgi:hypothetical protein